MSHAGTSGYRVMLIVVVVAASGCTAVRNEQHAIKLSICAHQAWRSFDTGVFVSTHSTDYASGWKAGYRSVLTGGDGRPPVVPPRRYWDPQFFCHSDPQGQTEWHKGFLCGATKALAKPSSHFVRPLISHYHNPQHCVPQHCVPQHCVPQHCAPQHCAPQPNTLSNLARPALPLDVADPAIINQSFIDQPLTDQSFSGHSIQQNIEPTEQRSNVNSHEPSVIWLLPEITPLPSQHFQSTLQPDSEIGDAS